MAEAEVVQEIAAIDRALNPARLKARLEGASVEDCVHAFAEIRQVGADAVICLFVAIGRAAELVTGSRDAVEGLARDFGTTTDKLYRIVKIYREIVIPRIEQQGEAAVWHLDEWVWYRVAVDWAEKAQKPALELIEYAEEKKSNDPGYSIREFKEDVLDGATDDGNTSSEAPAFDRALGKIGGFDDAAVEEWTKWASGRKNMRDKLRRAEDALTAVELAVVTLREAVGAKGA